MNQGSGANASGPYIFICNYCVKRGERYDSQRIHAEILYDYSGSN